MRMTTSSGDYSARGYNHCGFRFPACLFPSTGGLTTMISHRGCRLLALVAGAGMLLALPAARAADKKDSSSQAPPKGAIVLFNGKDLSGWVTTRGDKPAPWKV